VIQVENLWLLAVHGTGFKETFCVQDMMHGTKPFALTWSFIKLGKGVPSFYC
jgi:hypothetical protein